MISKNEMLHFEHIFLVMIRTLVFYLFFYEGHYVFLNSKYATEF